MAMQSRPITTGVLVEGFWKSQSGPTAYARLDLGHRRHGMAGVEGASTKATSSVAITPSSRPQRRSGETKDAYNKRFYAWLNKMSPSIDMWRRHRDIGHSERTARRRQQRLYKRAA